jgi:excisionase family DNA binding protein
MARRTPRDLIGLEEAGDLLGMSKYTVRRMISRGDLTGYRVGSSPNSPIKVSAAEVRGVPQKIPATGQ